MSEGNTRNDVGGIAPAEPAVARGVEDRTVEERYRNLLRHNVAGIYRYKAREPVAVSLPVEEQVERILDQGVLVEANQQVAQLHGLQSVEPLIGKTFREMYGDDQTVKQLLKLFVEQGYVNNGTESLETTLGGQQRWFLRMSHGIVEEGYLLGSWGTTIDITERKQVEEDLRRERELLREIAANFPNSYVSVIEKDLTVGFTSGQEFKKQNLNPDDYVGLTLEQVFGDSAPVIREHYLAAFAGEEREFELFFNQQHQLYRAMPLREQEGRIERILAVVENITERKQAEATYRAVFTTTNAAILISTLEGAVVDANEAFVALSGYSREELEKVKFSDFYTDPGDRRKLLAEFERDGQLLNHQLRVKTKSGERKWVSISGRPITRQGQTCLLSVVVDITEQKRMQTQLAQSDRLASMGMLAAGVAHEINNPLSYVLYNLESLNEDLPGLLEAIGSLRDPSSDAPYSGQPPGTPDEVSSKLKPTALEDIRERFEEALEGTRRIREIARGLATFARVEEDQLGAVDPARAAEVAANMALNEIKYRARLVKEYGEASTVKANEGRLSQVFLNLLINAAHAIDEGDVGNNEIRLRTWSEGDQVFVEVRDTGKGIAPEDQERVFEPFFTTKKIGAGSGLGLTIARNIVESYGGSIRVRSEPDKGSTFTVQLPVPTSESSRPDAAPPARAEPELGGRILIVDDERAVRAAVVRMLRGYETATAGSGAEARRILQQDQAFDLILCDMMMSDVSGMDLHRWLAAEHPRLARRLVFITGGAFTSGARDYLSQVDNLRLDKPFDTASFKQTVAEVIRAFRDGGKASS